MRICIIGCGYVGKAAALMWKAAGHEVTVTTRSLEKAYQLRPIADLVYVLSEDWHDLLEKQDVVLLCVAPTDNNYLDTYLYSAQKLVKGLCHSSVKQIIYTSSTSVYGEHQGDWVTENTPVRPLNANAQILSTTEETLLKATSPKRKVCIFRLGEIYGPGREIEERLSRMQGKTLPGTGENFTNLSHLEDILSGLNLAIEQQLEGTYNLCNDIHKPRRDFYQQLCMEHGLPIPLWDSAKSTPHGGNKRVDNTRLKSAGWQPLKSMFD